MTATPTPRALALAALAVLAGTAQAQFSSPIRDVENPDRFSYQEAAIAGFDPFESVGVMTFPTPAGRRYVIEHLALQCNTNSNVESFPVVQLNVLRVTPTGFAPQSLPILQMTRRGFWNGRIVWSGATTLKAYADPDPAEPTGGRRIQLAIFRTDVSVAPLCFGAITGHTTTP